MTLKALSPSLNMGHLTWTGRAGVSVLERMDEEVKGQRESGWGVGVLDEDLEP